MISKIIWSDDARKPLRKIDKQTQKKASNLGEKIASSKDPYDFGKPLLDHDKYGLCALFCLLCSMPKPRLNPVLSPGDFAAF
jgi:hypothetical protein